VRLAAWLWAFVVCGVGGCYVCGGVCWGGMRLFLSGLGLDGFGRGR
jgi:hypothetical protein